MMISPAESVSGSDKLTFIEAHLQEHHYIPIPIEDEDVDAIYAVFKDGIVDESVDVRRANVYHHYGIYMSWAKNSELTIKYFTMAIEQGYVYSMVLLGRYYDTLKRSELARKYYLMAAEKNNTTAMIYLAISFEEAHQYELAEKYYLQAIQGGSTTAIYDLADCYETQEKYSLAEEYYLQAIAKGDSDSMYRLGLLYDKKKKDREAAEKYYHMALHDKMSGDHPAPKKQQHKDTSSKLQNFYSPQDVLGKLQKLYSRDDRYEDLFALYVNYPELVENRESVLTCIEKMFSTPPSADTLNLFCQFKFRDSDAIPPVYKILHTLMKQDLDLMELHMKYRPHAEGFTQAKQDFFKKLAQ
jgi:tetratricopeptide (TPR) repeat protein